MIYFLIGTKAQLIKTFPLMKRLDQLGIEYRYLDTVQHGPLCAELRSIFKLREPDHLLAPASTSIERTADAVAWAVRVLWRAFRARRSLFPEPGVVVVHGDTLSTLLGLFIGKFSGQRICHLEAGERTHTLMRPFPEELIRRVVDRYSDLLLACGEPQAANLAAAGLAARSVNLGYNTLIDAVQAVVRQGGTPDGRAPVLVSIHRFETITSRERMEFLVSALERLARTERIVFGLHPPTRRKIEEFGLLARLQALPNVTVRGLFSYPEFIAAILGARFILTDGGGPQEESFFLGVPCLLLRSETERAHPNVFMAAWDLAKVEWFNQHCSTFRAAPLSCQDSPSVKAVEAIRSAMPVSSPVGVKVQ